MNNVLQQADVLIDAIKASNEYTQYQVLLNTIMKDEGVYHRMNDFRKRNFEIQVNEYVDTINESSNLQREYADVLNRPNVKEFLAAEQRYVKLLRKLYQKLDSQFQLNIDFLE